MIIILISWFLEAFFGGDDRFDWTPDDDAEYETLCREV